MTFMTLPWQQTRNCEVRKYWKATAKKNVPLSGTYGIGKNSASKEITEPGCGWYNVQYCANRWYKPRYSTIWESERNHCSGTRRCNGSHLEELLLRNSKDHVCSRCKQPLPNCCSRSPAVYNNCWAMSSEGKGMEHCLFKSWQVCFDTFHNVKVYCFSCKQHTIH